MKNSQKIKVKRLKNSPYAIQEGQIIGKGSFATIKRAYNLQNMSQQLAVKIISIQDEQTAKTIKSQLQMLKQLPVHPNLVNTMKVQISSEKNFYIIMEYCNQGNLEKYIFSNKNDLSEEKIWFFLKQFCEGYKVLYDRSLIHRDIKPENILIKNGNFKISDFGLARAISNVEFNENLSAKGTPLYMAPELHYEKQGSSKVDVFSLGIILYRLAFRGRFPFFDDGRTYHSISEYFQQLMLKKLMFPPKHNRSQQLVELIEKMLVKNKTDRISWKEIFAMDRIKRAVRNERRKDIVSMEEFRKSIMVVANGSVIDMKVIENGEQTGAEERNQQQKSEDGFLTIEEAFNKKNKSQVEIKLYRNKLIYTLIDLANRKFLTTLGTHGGSIHQYIREQVDRLVTVGMQFSLSLIAGLEDMSGDWNQISTGQIMNFEDIFDNDKDIITEKLKARTQVQDPEPCREGLYEVLLYNVLTEYQEYPKETQKLLKVCVGFMMEIYDLVVKLHEEHKLEQEDKTSILNYQEEEIEKFHEYLYSLENIKQSDISSKLRKMGLLFA